MRLQSARSDRSPLPRAIWTLGLVSLFMDVSSEIVHGLLPVFLVAQLGASMASLGALEGIAEAVALIFKVISGPVSDWMGRRKPLVVLGYLMGALSKPVFALAGTVGVVVGARFFDRMGKGIRGAPRDALVADLVSSDQRGRAFGLRQSLDTVGAFVGPLLAIALMAITQSNYRLIFWVATLPGLLAVALLIFGIEEGASEKKEPVRQIRLAEVKAFPYGFWFVAGAGAVFQLARFSEAFLILRARDLGLGINLTPLVLVAMNLVYAAVAYPVGYLSDLMRREWLLLVGILILALSQGVLGVANGLPMVFGGIVLWGLHLALTQGILTALVADTCPRALRGTAYGVFNLFSAVALIVGNLAAGVIWDRVGASSTFAVAAVLSLLGLFAIFATQRWWSSPQVSE